MNDEVYRKRVFSTDLGSAGSVDEVFCVTRIERRYGKSGDPYLRLSFSDCTGTVAGVAWDEVESLAGVLVEGGYARIQGEIGEYRGELQVRVLAAQAVGTAVDPAEYLPRGPVPAAESLAAIRALVGSLADSSLQALLLDFLDDPEFAFDFAAAPAAKLNHHAYVGGLAEHTLSVMELCDQAARHYADLDRDLLLAGAFCHDIGKTVELSVAPGFPYTEEGALLGHIAIGYAMVRERISRRTGFPHSRATDLCHLVLSHQGELAWGSPVQPLTLEALVLHFLDNLDSKVGTARPRLAEIEDGRTAYVRSLGRALFRRAAPGVAAPPAQATLFDSPPPD